MKPESIFPNQDFRTVIVSLRLFSGTFSRTDVHFRPSHPFIENFSNTNPGIMEKITRAGLSNLPSDRQTYIASKTYTFKQDPASIDAAFSEAVADFAFLVDPVDRAIESFKP